jgi:hypothetical protein
MEAAATFTIFAGVTYAALTVRDGMTEPDTLYHFKLAALILTEGPWVDVRWLPFTVLGERGPDHHWLWHVFLAPFTLIPDQWQALRVAAAVTCGLVPAVLVLVLRSLAVPYAPLFAIVAACGPNLPERLSRLRADNVVFILAPLALLLMARNRTLALAIVSFAFMQSYHGAVLLLPMVAAFALASLLVSRTVSLRSAIAVLAGLGLGLVASPWFPENVSYLLFHTLFKLQSGNWHLVGSEWRQPGWIEILRLSWLHHVVFAGALATFAACKRWVDPQLRLSQETVAALLLAALSLLMYQAALRNASLYALFATLAAALLWRDAALSRAPARFRSTIAAALASICAVGFLAGARQLLHQPIYGKPLNTYAAIVDRLERELPDGGVVFNVDWGDFTFLFWRSDRLRYVSGLDGNYLAYGDPRRFKVWYDVILEAPAPGGTAKALRDAFETQWVVVPRGRKMDRIAQNLLSEGDSTLAMKDEDGWLIHLVSPGAQQ